MDIHATVTGARQVELLFEEFPDRLYEAMRAEIEALSIELEAAVEAAAPSRTGKLRSEIRRRLFTEPTRISGYIDVAGDGNDAAKAGALEYGAHRATKVGSHNMRLDHAWAHKLAAPVAVLVDAYTRTPNIAEVAFERGPLDALAPEIVERLNAVVDAAVEAAGGGGA